MGILIIIGRVLVTVLIVIFSLFLLALLLVGLVLFVPVRYKAVLEQAPAMDGDKLTDGFFVKGIISWCLFVVRLPFSFENRKSSYSIKVLGIDIKKFGEKFKGRKKRLKSFKRKEKRDTGKKQDNTAKKHDDNGDIGKEGTDTQGSRENDRVQSTLDVRNKGTEPENGKKRIWEKPKVIFEKIKKIPSLIRGKKKNAKAAVDLFKSDMIRESICVVWENVVHLWSKLKPRHVKGRVHFGMSDPCLTGQILGGIAVFMGMTGLYLEITPDFEKSVLEGRIEIKGRLQFATLLKIIVRLYRDENIKKAAGKFGLF